MFVLSYIALSMFGPLWANKEIRWPDCEVQLFVHSGEVIAEMRFNS